MLNKRGDGCVKNTLSVFSCARNSEIEHFLKNNAIEFAKRKMSITYLVFNENVELAAYFTLTHKSTKIEPKILSNTQCRKLLTHAKLNQNGEFDVSAFLIAQLGKNEAVRNNISGTELLKFAVSIIENAQHLVGGSLIYLECEPEQKLLDFYQNENNRFVKYGKRISVEGKEYCQLLRFL